jgi:predicted transposase/invertase (TIGR01784 family)
MTDHDHPYKRLFSHPEMIADLIRGFLHQELAEVCDLSTLKRCNGTYVTDDLREREDDIIWQVKWGDTSLILYLLIEFQSQPDPSMPVRIMSYMSLLWQDLIRTKHIVPTKPLPAVIPLVLYNGDIPWEIPANIGDAIGEMPRGLKHMRPSVPYILLDEHRVNVDKQVEERNLTASLFKLEQSSTSYELYELGERLNAWMAMKEELEELRKDFSLVFEYSILPGHEEINNPNPFRGDTMISEKINRWIAEYKAEGKAEGRAEGRAEGIIILLKEHLLNNRLTKEEVRADIEKLQKNGVISQDDLQRAIKELGI